MTYDATGQQATASLNAITMGYDGDGLRLKKVENGVTTYYLRSTVLGQQTVCEINGSGAWQRGYVYLGGQLLAIQDVPQNRVLWTHQEPYSKAQRITDAAGAFVSGVEVEPFGLETNRSFDWNGVNQKRKFTTYDRDANGGDEAMFRRYAPKQDRFAQPDPYDGSMSLANPQSLNRYTYTNGDPVNFVDPLGLFASAPGGGGTCYVYGFQVNCGFAFGLLNAGLGFVTNGPGWYFDGSVYVGEVFGWLPGQNGDGGPWGVVGHFAHSFLNNSLVSTSVNIW
jgi:RHS repeat-associated protein